MRPSSLENAHRRGPGIGSEPLDLVVARVIGASRPCPLLRMTVPVGHEHVEETMRQECTLVHNDVRVPTQALEQGRGGKLGVWSSGPDITPRRDFPELSDDTTETASVPVESEVVRHEYD